jgi:hypothetical protein
LTTKITEVERVYNKLGLTKAVTKDLVKYSAVAIGDKVYQMPCWVDDVPNEVYHGKELQKQGFVGHSGIVKLAKSAAHFKASLTNNESTPAMKFGSAAHIWMLEDPEDRVIVCDKKDREGKYLTRRQYKAFGEWEKEAIEEKGAEYVISHEEKVQLDEMKLALLKHPTAAALIKRNKRSERSGFAIHPRYDGIKVRIRADIFIDDDDLYLYADYKTCKDASTEAFSKAAFEYGYDVQADLYREIGFVIDGRWPQFMFIAQEKTPPYAVNVLKANHPDYIDIDKFKIGKKGNGIYDGTQIPGGAPQIMDFMSVGRKRSNIGLETYFRCIENPQLFEIAYPITRLDEMITPGYIRTKYL